MTDTACATRCHRLRDALTRRVRPAADTNRIGL